MIRRFLKDSAIYMIPSILNRCISIFLVPLYTRVLSPADYGALDMMMVFMQLVSIIVGCNMFDGVARFYTPERDTAKKKVYASTGLWFFLASLSSVLAVYVIFAGPLSKAVMGKEGFTLLFRLAALYFTVNTLRTFVQNQLRFDLKSVPYVISCIINMFAVAALGVYLTYYLRLGLYGLLTAMLAAAAISLFYSLIHCVGGTYIFKFNPLLLKDMLTFSLPLMPATLSIYIGTFLGRFIIRYYLSLSALGLFGIAGKLAALTSLLVVGVPTALSPLIYTYYTDPDTPRQIGVIFRIYCAAAILMFAGLSLYALDILVIFTTPAYYSAYKIAPLLVAQVLVSQFVMFLPGIVIAKKTRYTFFIQTSGTLLSTIFALLLVPKFGIMGAALAALTGSLVTSFATYVISQRLYKVDLHFKPLILPLTLSICFILLADNITMGFIAGMALKAVLLTLVVASFFLSGLVTVSDLKKLIKRA